MTEAMEDWSFRKEDLEKALEEAPDITPYSKLCRECTDDSICIATFLHDDGLAYLCPLLGERIKEEWRFDEKIKLLMKGRAKIVEVGDDDGED